MARSTNYSAIRRPVGWRNESYRHYLAAKGITTNRFIGTNSGSLGKGVLGGQGRYFAKRKANPFTRDEIKELRELSEEGLVMKAYREFEENGRISFKTQKELDDAGIHLEISRDEDYADELDFDYYSDKASPEHSKEVQETFERLSDDEKKEYLKALMDHERSVKDMREKNKQLQPAPAPMYGGYPDHEHLRRIAKRTEERLRRMRAERGGPLEPYLSDEEWKERYEYNKVHNPKAITYETEEGLKTYDEYLEYLERKGRKE